MAHVGQQRFGCYIGNIDRSVTLEVLRQVFSQCGTIVDCSLNGRDEDPYRYGFIDFATEDDRARAMKYNGFTLAGRKIKVGISKGNVGRPEGYNNNPTPAPAASNTASSAGQHPQVPSQPQVPAVSVPASFLPGMVQQQQQQGATLLLQLLQQGAIDVNNLTAEQQQVLMASLLPQAPAAAPGMHVMPPTAPMAYVPPPPQQPWGAPRGVYAGGPLGRPAPYTRPPANPQPPEETLKLREVQRKQFLDVVRRDAEKYERKLAERNLKEGRTGSISGSEESSSDEEGEKGHRHSRRKIEGGEDTEPEKSATLPMKTESDSVSCPMEVNCNNEGANISGEEAASNGNGGESNNNEDGDAIDCSNVETEENNVDEEVENKC
ncbi:RNA-binding protein 29, putative [Trypanosoma equiperdum]|uniref:RNA-binding protein, putative n=4 Tax=Trypanozoon TaxID=39700 RepID=Q388M7_TRYB2|nr:RNA-binding protein, putative [Trypanosoma brucei gambiense DAL972]XP_827855.1 uncharacterized protein Tb10.61.3200 [Trypanosoma brucei brucei TREU927]RHW69545.1 RNA-binding protein 29 [Trypanosoma brucei equiperdum]SCU69545.1 RNA-binding protein 29, putative [Trypanosoma equiperdum]EAN78743.1 RNA-binding protein, putative [Trypanosoma brucei brucei TREU927]CBH16582.1 RNA-binding protein, putative [Trypanosoma brucei gambiense DAL972]|eukprot:XP_011778846.1 RNA-binding protein, putative [Trypanosoma brucei gambiense DAL972]